MTSVFHPLGQIFRGEEREPRQKPSSDEQTPRSAAKIEKGKGAISRISTLSLFLIDHDILIDEPDWPAGSVDLIGDRPISVQPWGRMRYLDRTGRTIRQAESATAIAKSGRYPSTGPGAASVARRRDLEEIGGIYASNIVGGGDLVWFHALSGMRLDFLKRQSHAVRAHQEAWIAHVGGRIGYDCHPAPARHIWHGDAKHRQYVTRDQILKTHHFDPNRHIEPDPNTGLLRWTNQAPRRLRHDVETYFLGRREDG